MNGLVAGARVMPTDGSGRVGTLVGVFVAPRRRAHNCPDCTHEELEACDGWFIVRWDGREYPDGDSGALEPPSQIAAARTEGA